MEKPEIPSLEEIAKIQKERTLSDAELIKGGASYRVAEQSSLELTEKQKEEIRMEHEGELYPDAAAYVKLNKMVAVPAKEVPEQIRNLIGHGWISGDKFYFIDRDGNLAQVNIDYKRISSITRRKSMDSLTDIGQFHEELEKHGFNFFQSSFDALDISGLIGRYTKKVIQADKEEANKEFDF